MPARDPASAVLANPMVSEEKRFCGKCSAKVGRGKDGKPGAAEGKCENCGTPFSFLPKLQPNELVGGQYEVLGALAYGGLGWIYLAQDHNVSDRWVVLKGLIDSGDPTALAAAANEQRFLAEVEHPNIVKIHNFVQHPDRQSETTVGYIVMEYVGGQSLRQLALAHHRESRRPEPLPIGQVIAYGLEILPALGYLHSQGLLYCDLKPDNVIQTNEQLKLIDLGAVRRIDDYESPLFFTTGYSAPELATQGASVASDLFTVGRTLAVLSFEFTGYTTKFKTTLPSPDAVPLFALFGSYYRFLRRATHADPDRRFLSAEEMADQLTGVLREIMALGTGKPRPGASTVFGPESRTFGVQLVVPEAGASVPLPGAAEVVAGLPIPQVDTDDPAAGVLATTTALDPRGAIEALAGAPRESIEVRLRIVRARIELGELAEAQRQLQAAQYLAIKNGFPHDWRIDWYRGLIELAGGRSRVAHVAFEAVYDDLPGEVAPKLALGISAEGVGDYFAAARFYELVWRTDRTYVSAAFGLARVYLAQGARSQRGRGARDGAAVLDALRRRAGRGDQDQDDGDQGERPRDPGDRARPARRVGPARAAPAGRRASDPAQRRRARSRVRVASRAEAGRPDAGSARCWGVRSRSVSCGSGWSGATAPWRGWRARSSSASSWWTARTPSARAPSPDPRQGLISQSRALPLVLLVLRGQLLQRLAGRRAC